MIEDKKWTYSFKFLRQFIRDGRAYGDVGMIPLHRKNGMTKYRGFGTIEHPMKTMCSMTLMHMPEFDDPPITGSLMTGTYKLVFINIGEYRKQ